MHYLGIALALITAITLILRECGVFEAMKRRNLEKENQEQEIRHRQRKPEKVYDHEYSEDKHD